MGLRFMDYIKSIKILIAWIYGLWITVYGLSYKDVPLKTDIVILDWDFGYPLIFKYGLSNGANIHLKSIPNWEIWQL